MPGEVGQQLWGLLDLGVGLGGPGRSVFATPGVAGGVAVFPSREGQLFGLALHSGELRWRVALEPGRMTRCLLPCGGKLLAAVSDERPLDRAGQAALVEITPDSGEVNTLWVSPGHQLSHPVLAQGMIILRTSTSELVALSQESYQPRWRQPLQAWWVLPPFLAGDVVLAGDGRPMHGEGKLLAFGVADGKPRWAYPTDGLINRPLTADEDTVMFVNGRRQVVALERRSGELLWERDYRRIYSPPLIGGEGLHLVVRGPAPAGVEGHYVWQAMSPTTGEVLRETPLPANARARLLAYQEDTLFLGDDAGYIRAYRASSGELLWAYPLGSDEDPIHTEMVIADGLLLAGTYAGRVVAIRVAAASPRVEPPQAYLERGELGSAAAAYALGGDLRRAAEIYAQELKDIPKALTLYEKAGLFQEAGELARSVGMPSEASAYFEQAGDYRALAESLLQGGDQLGAAAAFEKCGDLMRAAKYYEEGGDLRRSMEVYKRLKNWKKVIRLWRQVTPDEKDIYDFEQSGQFREAGEAARKLGMLEKAIKLFQQAEDPDSEFEALQALADERPESWALERLAELARQKGRFETEAAAWEKLGRPQKAALAYHRAAQQCERMDIAKEERIAELYARARRFYDDSGLEEECQECQAKVVYYQRLPQVIIEGQTRRAFREGEFNLLDLHIRNVGRSVARDIRLQISGGRFEVDESSVSMFIHSLSPGREKEQRIALRPLENQVGPAVPLILEWRWCDPQGNEYHNQSETYVNVKARGSTTSSTPQHIHYHGPVYQGENVEVVGGDKIGGDQVEGDKVESGAQKGDRVEIHRGQGVRLVGDGLGEADTRRGPECPNCHLPVEADQQFCEACGKELL